MNEIKCHCSYDQLVPLHKLIPHPRNANDHPEKQVDLLAKIIDYNGIRHPIIVSKRSGFIVAGHCRLEAAEKLGLTEYPVNFQEFENEAAEYSFLEADNHLAEISKWNKKKALKNIEEIDDLDLDMLGMLDFSIDDDIKPIDEDELGNILTNFDDEFMREVKAIVVEFAEIIMEIDSDNFQRPVIHGIILDKIKGISNEYLISEYKVRKGL